MSDLKNKLPELTNKFKNAKCLFIIGAGHGGINPDTGKYVTPGKRSPKENGETLMYEGVNNRINAELIVEELEERGLSAVNLVDTWEDVSLTERVYAVNELCKDRECMYISVHSNAAGNGKDWHSATGIDTFHYLKASSKSRDFAKIIQDELIDNLGHLTKNRGVKGASFYVLRKTNCPAVLLELGFHTNLSEVKLMQSMEWRQGVITAVADSCQTWVDEHI